MATKVHMEALSPTMEEGRLAKWLKNEGDQIKEGDVLAEIETDKATMELVARGSGVLRKRTLEEGGTAPVGTVIGVIAAADEDIGDVGGGAAPSKPAEAKQESKPAEAKQEAKPAAQEKSPSAPSPSAPSPNAPAPSSAPAPVGNGGGRVKASPLARKMAAESGVELKSIQGSGPGGRITKRDIEAAGSGAGAAAPRPRVAAAVGGGPDYEDVPLTQMRKTIAKRLVTSIGPIPTFYLTVEIDMSNISRARENVNKRLEKSGVKTSVNDFIIKAVAAALAQHPEVNASWTDTAIRRYNRVHIGVAVAVEDGLITPIVRDANVKGVAQISQEVRELAGRAREKKLQPDEYTGATFSISNLGMFGIEEFTAIINPPEAAILAVGTAEDKVVVEDGEMVVRSRMKITMSCDHRVIDGATGAKFLQTVKNYLEEPAMMLV